MYDNDDDESYGSGLELSEESEGENQEESVVEEDEVQITHDPQLPNDVSSGSNARKSNQSKASYVMRRKTMNEVVYIPKITTKSDDWATILARGAKELPGMFYKEREVSTAMRSNNAIYIIAYYLSILNTDPSYMDIPMACPNRRFEGYARGAHTDHEYDDFRMILGVVIAYITAYLMHFNIEISSAMRDYGNSIEFDLQARFRTWGRRTPDSPGEWIFQGPNEFPEFNPQFMRFITPFNFMYVRWNEFSGMVRDMLDVWALDDKSHWVILAEGAYRRMTTRGEYLQTPMMKQRMYRWKKWRGDPNILYGMARTKVARDALESYEGILGHPFDFLQESISGHKMEHTVAEIDYDTLVYNLGDIIGEINDVFPGAPNGPFTFPRGLFLPESLKM